MNLKTGGYITTVVLFTVSFALGLVLAVVGLIFLLSVFGSEF